MTTIRQTKQATLIMLLACSSAWSFQAAKESERANTNAQLSTGTAAPAATVNAIMAQAVNNIAIRYNLNDEQKEQTRELMEREVHKFLRDHEDSVWPVIRDLIQNRFRHPENEEDRKRLGKATVPLAKRAQDAIVRANEEWRFILNEEQKAVHDYDLREMKKTFEIIDGTVESWADGRATEDGLFPAPRRSADQPPRPSRPKHEGLPPAQKVVFNPDRLFEALVEEFIRDYELAPGQVTSARSILEEFKAKAKDFKSGKKDELARINRELADAHERRDTQARKRLDADRKKVLEPVKELANAMEERLKNLLTTAQIQKHAEKVKAGSTARVTPKKTKRARSAASREAKPARSTTKETKSDEDDK